MVEVELVYIPAEGEPVHQHLLLDLRSTVVDALNTSGLFISNPEAREFAVGIFGKQVSLDRLLRTGDRIEVYRPLVVDPKERRKQRAKEKKNLL